MCVFLFSVISDEKEICNLAFITDQVEIDHIRPIITDEYLYYLISEHRPVEKWEICLQEST